MRTVRPEDLKISKEELKLLKAIVCLVGTVPRTVKRYVNIYRIVRAHEGLGLSIPEQDDSLSAEEQEAQRQQQLKELLSIMFVLALHIGEYKDQAHDLVELLRQNEDTQLHSLYHEEASWENIKSDLIQHKPISPLLNLTGQEVLKHQPFISRFSFGGEAVAAV